MEAQGSRETRFREELDRLLTSPEFASSKQLQDFLRYTSEKAFEGVAQLDQAEIAAAVLGRGPSFNPIEDASVRKAASLARQRIEQYYGRVGHSSEVVVSLPVRSYVPRFEERHREPNLAASREEPARPELTRNTKNRTALTITGVLAAVLLIVAGTYMWRSRRVAYEPSSSLTILTDRGDIAGGTPDAPPASVQLGRTLTDVDEVSTALSFAPTEEAQQAGILIWQDVDHYIQLGRRFAGRNQIFLSFHEGRSADRSHTSIHYDEEGQTARPLYLLLRKEKNTYEAFTGGDGIHWTSLEPPFELKRPLVHPRLGIFAYNGRREAARIPAIFQKTSTGPTFTAPPGSGNATQLMNGWREESSCSAAVAFDGSYGFQFSYGSEVKHCNSEWTRMVGQEDWAFETRLDFLPVPGVSAGLGVRGNKGALRLVRYFSNNPSICLIYDSRTFSAMPDLNGSPPVYLRLENQGGFVSGGYSADGVAFRQARGRIPIAELGDGIRAGLRFSVNETREGETPTTFRFLYLHQIAGALRPYR